MLLSSHILAEALSDRVTIIRDGRTVETGTPAGLPGVHDLTADGLHVRGQVDQVALDTVLGRLHQAGVRALTCRPPTLEELFLRHYSAERSVAGAPMTFFARHAAERSVAGARDDRPRPSGAAARRLDGTSLWGRSPPGGTASGPGCSPPCWPSSWSSAHRLNQLVAQQRTYRDQAGVTAFFDGLELVPPGVVPVPQWRPDSDMAAKAPTMARCGVGRKP